DADEYQLAQTLRERSPSATPNARLVAMADKKLGREGRMIDAIRKIGRGANAFEGTPFAMPID
ncbi:MAG: tyrosine protein phosphatase, partial [Roseibium sp.]|nr:tyrosine protein phosphatase [Roseibium sp.]